MQNANPKPILNTSLPTQFRQIWIELAREPDHPEGDSDVAYVIVAPLDADDRIDPDTLARASRGLPDRAVAARPSKTITVILSHRQGGSLGFHYDGDSQYCPTRSAPFR